MEPTADSTQPQGAPEWMLYDLALLHTASRFDLSDQVGRSASALWLRELFIGLLKELKPQLVLELGAAEASFSRNMSELLAGAEIHAFEANPHVHARHRERAEAAGVHYHNLAVGPEPGRTAFQIGVSRDGQPLKPTKTSNSVLQKPRGVEYRSVEVEMASVDAFTEQNGLADRSCAMWIDVEGLAYQVLSGARRTLKATVALLIELEDKAFWSGQVLAPEVKSLLWDAGFVPVARDFEYRGQYNVLFVALPHLNRAQVRRTLEEAFSGTTAAAAQPR